MALLGSKFMGRAHSNAWLKVARFYPDVPVPRMHTVAARDADELATFAETWGWEHTSTDWRGAVAAGEVDLVDIGTPNAVHAEQAITALEAGKHVACEKPLAGTLADAEAMVAAAEGAAGRTFVWFNYRARAGGGAGAPARRVRCARPDLPRARRLPAELGRARHAAHVALRGRRRRLRGRTATSTPTSLTPCASSPARRSSRSRAPSSTRSSPSAPSWRAPPAARWPAPARGTGQAMGQSTVDDAVLFLARMSGGGLASFESSRLATGYHNANRFEIHGESGALRFDFERMNELGFYDRSRDAAVQGWTMIDVTRGGDGHPYADAWWPDSHGLGYEHSFVNQARDILAVIGGGEPVVALPDFADALRTQRVLEAAIRSARERAPIDLDHLPDV